MGIDEDLNVALNDDALENVSGGVEASNLLFTGKSPKASSTVQKGKAPKAGSLVYKETKLSKNDIADKTYSGDVIGKGTMC